MLRSSICNNASSTSSLTLSGRLSNQLPATAFNPHDQAPAPISARSPVVIEPVHSLHTNKYRLRAT